MSPSPGRIALLLACPAILQAAGALQGQQAERTEPEAKAALLQKILGFVNWPPAAVRRPFRVAFIGRGPVAREFKLLRDAGTLGSNRVEVNSETLDADLDAYQVVFLSGSDSRHLRDLADRLAGKPILTVCESPSGCDRGIMLTLLVRDEHIQYEINLKRAKRAGLVLNSQILQMAAKVCGGGGS